MADRVKVPASAPQFELVHAEGFRVLGKLPHVVTNPSSFYQRDQAENPGHEYLVVVYQCPEPPFADPSGSRYHLAMYFRRKLPDADAQSTFDKLWTKFRNGDDKFRSERWKVLPHLADGPWMVSMAMGSRPAILATKLEHTWFVGDNYVEIDCDVGKSLSYLPAISTLIGLLQQYAKSLVIDVGFAVEAQDEDELPEALVCAARLHHMVPSSPAVVDVAGVVDAAGAAAAGK